MPIGYLFTLLILLLTTDRAVADEKQLIELDPLVVTASRIEEPLSEIPASVEVVTQQTIRDRQPLTLDEGVRPVTGLTIRTYGGADPWARITIRGTEDNHSLIMIDGIRINPPYSQSTLAGTLLLNNTERIEIIKGSYSALYGSEAIGGVVNVITKTRPGLSFSVLGGTHRTSDNSLSYSTRYKDVVYSLGYANLSAEGFKYSGPYWNNSLLGRVDIPLTATSSLQISTTYWDWKKYDYTLCCEIDGSGNIIFILDKDSNTKEDTYLTSIRLTNHTSEEWDYSMTLSRYAVNSHTDNLPETATAARPFPLEIDSDIRSERNILEMQNNLHHGENDTVTMGFLYTWENIRKEEFGNLESLGMGPSMDLPDLNDERGFWSVYLQKLFKIKDQSSLAAGVRFENGPGYSSALIPKASALYVLPETDTRLHVSIGQGIRAPSLEELYHPVQGNTDLMPEKSTSVEAGFKQPFRDGRVWLAATGFAMRLENLIDLDVGPSGTPVYMNMGRSKITGIETTLRLDITDKLQGNIGYTRLSTKNLETDQELPFRPDDRWTFDIRYTPIAPLVLDVNAEFAGEAFNPYDFLVGLDGRPLSSNMASYQVVNMAAAYRVADGDPLLGALDFTLKLNNIFDEEYTEVPGFPSYGFTFLAGIRATR